MNNNPYNPNDVYTIYNYSTAGFDNFLTRSIDANTGSFNLDSSPMTNIQSRQVNYDQSQVSGSLGDKLQIGNIVIDGQNGRISIYDADNNETTRVGNLDD